MLDLCLCPKRHIDVKWNQKKKYNVTPKFYDWNQNPFIWLHYVESSDGLQPKDDVLRSTDSRYWSIHDVQRYFCGDLHCEQVLFPCQYPNLRMPTHLGNFAWRFYTALKKPSQLYLKEFHRSLELTLKKMELEEAQIDRLILCDELINVRFMDYFKRKTFFRSLLNILSFQDDLQLVSFENLRCTRLEGVRLIQQLACFNSHSLKYLYLWQFVQPDENPMLVNYNYITAENCPRLFYYLILIKPTSCGYHSNFENMQIIMSTDEEKSKVLKLLQDLDVPEIKLPERCQNLLKSLHQNFDKELDAEYKDIELEAAYENPYVADQNLLEENERKLRELYSNVKKTKENFNNNGTRYITDPKRPWRTNSSKERLLRIDGDLKRHFEKASSVTTPMTEVEMKELVNVCREEAKYLPLVGAERLKETVDEARRTLPNFQFKKVVNSTATVILSEAHDPTGDESKMNSDILSQQKSEDS